MYYRLLTIPIKVKPRHNAEASETHIFLGDRKDAREFIMAIHLYKVNISSYAFFKARKRDVN